MGVSERESKIRRGVMGTLGKGERDVGNEASP